MLGLDFIPRVQLFHYLPLLEMNECHLIPEVLSPQIPHQFNDMHSSLKEVGNETVEPEV